MLVQYGGDHELTDSVSRVVFYNNSFYISVYFYILSLKYHYYVKCGIIELFCLKLVSYRQISKQNFLFLQDSQLLVFSVIVQHVLYPTNELYIIC